MVSLDLRWLLFGLLVAAALAVTALVGLSPRLSRRRGEGPRHAGVLWPVLDQAPVGIVLLATPRTFDYANSRARSLLGLPPSPGSLPEAEWASTLEQDCALARQEPSARVCSRSLSLPSGHWIRWWVLGEADHAVVFLLDVTAQQRAEQASSHLLTDLAHELRTPLATLLTHLEVLLSPNLPPALSQQSIYLLKAETQRMVRLVNTMLELGRLETGAEIEHRPVDLSTLAEQALAQVAGRAMEREVALRLETGTQLPLVLGDADRLKQVLLNLLDNSIKYCRPGDQAVLSLHATAEGIVCEVRDNGPGISAQDLPHVTRRFYRGVSHEEQGSGLGLTLAQEILRHHGSRLEIESRTEGDGAGTCVRFHLPVLTGETEGGMPG